MARKPDDSTVVELRRRERAKFRSLRETYVACKLLAEQVWGEELDKAAKEQQELAERMRDRGGLVTEGEDETWLQSAREIHVPLFTPRDRLQFIKEATVAIKMAAEKMGVVLTSPLAVEDPSDAGWMEVTSNEDETNERRVFKREPLSEFPAPLLREQEEQFNG